MARFVTRIADLCRHRAHEELFLRRFRMMRPGDDEEAAGPGWYESSRELLRGLQVDEGRDDEALLAEWHEALRRPGPVLRPLARDA
ncbi:MAG: hypothetical protein KA766_02370 [Piscinibacter sp.]|uniref:hypothetical protein n=1 Tax=Piscinibacter sp. TaxID=1903157 RepID=UPI001B6B9522|nr:hypothetical protein [Piscinibacter sp.]MBP5988826.1 hypothetical protein [Piscinibacter sp.]MBP6026454.1 hypothetical protein [Piscinibacter sp.]